MIFAFGFGIISIYFAGLNRCVCELKGWYCSVLYFAEMWPNSKQGIIIILILICIAITFFIPTLYHPCNVMTNTFVLPTTMYTEYGNSVNYKNPAVVNNQTDVKNINTSSLYPSRPSQPSQPSRPSQPNRPTSLGDILIAIKTTQKNHRTRLQILFDTWISQALQSVSFYQPKAEAQTSSPHPSFLKMLTHTDGWNFWLCPNWKFFAVLVIAPEPLVELVCMLGLVCWFFEGMQSEISLVCLIMIEGQTVPL